MFVFTPISGLAPLSQVKPVTSAMTPPSFEGSWAAFPKYINLSYSVGVNMGLLDLVKERKQRFDDLFIYKKIKGGGGENSKTVFKNYNIIFGQTLGGACKNLQYMYVKPDVQLWPWLVASTHASLDAWRQIFSTTYPMKLLEWYAKSLSAISLIGYRQGTSLV